MILIIGGAYQGKHNFAEERFAGREIVSKYNEKIETWMKSGQDAVSETRIFLAEHPGAVILLDEIGCGITPMEADDRRLRDEVGRTGCCLAEAAEEVYRVFAGIGTRIK